MDPLLIVALVLTIIAILLAVYDVKGWPIIGLIGIFFGLVYLSTHVTKTTGLVWI